MDITSAILQVKGKCMIFIMPNNEEFFFNHMQFWQAPRLCDIMQYSFCIWFVSCLWTDRKFVVASTEREVCYF